MVVTINISSDVQKDERVKVTIPMVTLSSTANTPGTVTIDVEQSGSKTSANVRLVSLTAAPSKAEAKLGTVGTHAGGHIPRLVTEITDPVVIELPYNVGNRL